MLLFHFFALLLSLVRLTPAPAGDPPAADDPPTERTRATDVLQRYGDNVVRMAEKVAELESDLYKARRSRDDYKRANDDLTAKQVPDGATVLSAADKVRWDAYQQLGKPDELTQQLTDGRTAVTERDSLKRAVSIRQVADETGMKADTLAAIDQLYGGLAYEVKATKEMQNGRQVDVKRAYVKREDKEVELTELVKGDYPSLAAALTTAPPVQPPIGTPPRDRMRALESPPVDMQAPNIRL